MLSHTVLMDAELVAHTRGQGEQSRVLTRSSLFFHLFIFSSIFTPRGVLLGPLKYLIAQLASLSTLPSVFIV